jgi:YHS domain-containing protein
MLAPAASPQTASTPESFSAPQAADHAAGLPSLESALTTQSDAAPSLDLTEPDDTLANPFPEMPEAEADAAAGPYTGLELEGSPYDPATGPSLSSDSGAFATPAPQAEPAGPQLASESPLRPAADHGPVLIAPGASVPSELPLVQPGRPIQTTPTQATAGTRSSASETLALIASRQGLTGVKGFCPVMLKDFRDLVDANQDFTVIYQGQQYWFSSEEAKQAFLLNPGTYLPAGGGIDPVVYHQSGQSVAGSLDNAVWYHGQLYLFSSHVTKAEFVASPRAHAFE